MPWQGTYVYAVGLNTFRSSNLKTRGNHTLRCEAYFAQLFFGKAIATATIGFAPRPSVHPADNQKHRTHRKTRPGTCRIRSSHRPPALRPHSCRRPPSSHPPTYAARQAGVRVDAGGGRVAHPLCWWCWWWCWCSHRPTAVPPGAGRVRCGRCAG